MSKTFDASLMKEAAAEYWKRFAASATASLNRYRYDLFFRTEVNVIGLLIIFSLILLGLVGMSFTLLYQDISRAIVEGIERGFAAGDPAQIGPSIVSEIQAVRSQTLLAIIGAITFVTVIFGYIIARVTLSPARNALAAQKQFIGNIAHEIRTPLSVIKTNTEVAL